MATYAIVFYKSKHEASLSSFFSFFSDEVVRFDVGGGRCAVFSRGVNSGLDFDNGFFKGYLVNHEKKIIRIDELGGPVLESPGLHEGCYLNFLKKEEGFLVENDYFGQMLRYYFNTGEVACISDSVSFLVSLRRSLGIRNNLNTAVVNSRSWLNSISYQQVGPESVVNEIYYTPPHAALLGGANLKEVFLRPVSYGSEYFKGEAIEYESAIVKSAGEIASTLNSIGSVDGLNVSIDLSGGVDSRVCLAAALASPSLNGRFSVNSVLRLSDDYKVAKKISSHYGLPLNVGYGSGERIKDAFLYWFSFNAGIYDPLYCPASESLSGKASVGGHGGAVYKGAYKWRSAKSIYRSMKNVDRLVKDSFFLKMQQGLESIGSNCSEAFSSELLHLLYRNPIHSGRFVMGGGASFRPLMNKRLCLLSQNISRSSSFDRKSGNNISRDILIALNSELAAFDFSSPEKNISSGYIKSFSSSLSDNSLKVDVSRYLMDGDLVKPFGILKGAKKILKKSGFSGSLFSEEIDEIVLSLHEQSSLEFGALADLYKKSTEAESSAFASSKINAIKGKYLSFLLDDGYYRAVFCE